MYMLLSGYEVYICAMFVHSLPPIFPTNPRTLEKSFDDIFC